LPPCGMMSLKDLKEHHNRKLRGTLGYFYAEGSSDQRVTFGLARGDVSGYDIPSIRDI